MSAEEEEPSASWIRSRISAFCRAFASFSARRERGRRGSPTRESKPSAMSSSSSWGMRRVWSCLGGLVSLRRVRWWGLNSLSESELLLLLLLEGGSESLSSSRLIKSCSLARRARRAFFSAISALVGMAAVW